MQKQWKSLKRFLSQRMVGGVECQSGMFQPTITTPYLWIHYYASEVCSLACLYAKCSSVASAISTIAWINHNSCCKLPTPAVKISVAGRLLQSVWDAPAYQYFTPPWQWVLPHELRALSLNPADAPLPIG